jgi:muramidase (phage lysozyme)
MHPNRKAFLDMIAVSELGQRLIDLSDNGYNVLVGSTPSKPLLFNSYKTHPRILNKKMRSTAAGRYQLLARYYDAYSKSLGLPDFSPASQDAIALQQIKECRALDDIDKGYIRIAIAHCANIWASFPGSPYGQHTNTMDFMITAYLKNGGTIA